MNIKTINHIETSSLCDRKCRYCPSQNIHLHRPTGLMTWAVFTQTMEWLKYFVSMGTQTELNLHGVGEATLNPLLPEMIAEARRILPLRYAIHINTNGQWIDQETTDITEKELAFVKSLRDGGITHIDITGHDAFRTAKMIRVFSEIGIKGNISFDFMLHPNNWAGQVDWFSPKYSAGKCPWINRGQVYIMHNGDITRCCIDAYGVGLLGNVYDATVKDLDITTFDLCKTCHHDTQ